MQLRIPLCVFHSVIPEFLSLLLFIAHWVVKYGGSEVQNTITFYKIQQRDRKQTFQKTSKRNIVVFLDIIFFQFPRNVPKCPSDY